MHPAYSEEAAYALDRLSNGATRGMVKVELAKRGLAENHCDESIEAAAGKINFRKRFVNGSIAVLGFVGLVAGIYFFVQLNQQPNGLGQPGDPWKMKVPVVIGMVGMLGAIYGGYQFAKDKV